MVRILQVIFALAVMGMYGHQYEKVMEAGGYLHARLYLAEAIGILSILVAASSLLILLSRWNQEWTLKVSRYQWPFETLLVYVSLFDCHCFY